jgi:hypothetical protein
MAGVGTFETAADVRYTTASRANADIVQRLPDNRDL